MTVADDVAAPASLDALRQAHLAMMQSVRSKNGEQTKLAVQDFLRNSRRLGRFLDDFAERDAAQAILDYWALTAIGEPGSGEAYPGSDLMTLEPFDPALTRSLDRTRQPFVGLDPFTESMAHQFFGREEARQELAVLLDRCAMVVVSGPSGSGKSSLVLAGVVPRLADPAAHDVQRRSLPLITPGGDPLAALLQAVRPVGAPETWLDQARSALERRPASFAELVQAARGSGPPPVLIVDQAEELFTLTTDEAVRLQFAEALSAAASLEDVRVIVTIREDYTRNFLALAPIKAFKGSLGEYTPPPLTPAQLREVIEHPAATVGLRIDPAVVDTLIKEVLGEPAALPLLQFALLQLWKQVKFDRIGWDEYSAVGPPSKALSNTAEEVYANLGLDENRQTAQALFLALTKAGVGDETVRRRRPREALWDVAAADRVNRVLQRFTEAGLIRRLPGREIGDDRFEIAHEALLRNWPRFAEWARERRQKQGSLQRLSATAELWDRADRGRGYLLSGVALAEAERTLANATLDDANDRRRLEAFMKASRRQRLVLIFLAAAIILALAVFGLTALQQYSEKKSGLIKQKDQLNLQYQTDQRETVSLADTANDRANLAEQSLLNLVHQGKVAPEELPTLMRSRLNQLQAPSTLPLAGAGYDSAFLGRALPMPTVAGQRPIVLNYPHFSVVYSQEQRRPLFAASTLDRTSVTPRPPPLQEPRLDPRLPAADQPRRLDVLDINLFPLASWREVVWGADPALAINATTAAPGLVPQNWDFNQGPWARMEGWLQTSHNPKAIKVVFFTGPVYRPDDPVVAGVAIPQAFWKIAVSTSAGAPDRLVVNAFLVDGSAGPTSVASLQTTVAEISRLTGLRFKGLDAADTTAPAATAQTPAAAAPPLKTAAPAPSSVKPTVYLQFATVNRSDINDVAQALRDRDYRVPGAERIEAASQLREVRYYHEADAANARRLAADTSAVLQAKGYGDISVKVRAFTGFKGKKPAAGVLELWLDLPPRPTASAEPAPAPAPVVAVQNTPAIAQTPPDRPDRDLSHLQPEAEKAARALIANAEAEGIPIRLLEGRRSPERQAWLYASGRTRPGSIMTNARQPTVHGTGLAFDVAPMDSKTWNDSAQWRRLGELGKALGLVWGGDNQFPDVAHFETPGAAAALRKSKSAPQPQPLVE